MTFKRVALIGDLLACLLVAAAAEGAIVKVSKADGRSVRLRVTASTERMTQEAMHVISSMASHQINRFKGVNRLTLTRHYDAAEMKRREARSRIVRSKREDEADEPALLMNTDHAFTEKYLVGKKGVKNFLVFGPYAEIPAGRYIVAFRVKPLKRSRHRLGTVGVAEKGERVHHADLWSGDLFMRSWNARGVRYEPSTKRERVEFRVWQNKKPIAIDRIYLFRIDG